MPKIITILITIDRIGNAIAGGNPNAVISARVGYFSSKKKTPFRRYWQFLEIVINFSFYPIDGPNHCFRAFQNDKNNNFIHGSDFAKATLGIIIIFASLFIAVSLRVATVVIPSWHYKSRLAQLESNEN